MPLDETFAAPRVSAVRSGPMRGRAWVGRCYLTCLVLEGPTILDEDGTCPFFCVEPSKFKARLSVLRHRRRGKVAHVRPKRDPPPYTFRAR